MTRENLQGPAIFAGISTGMHGERDRKSRPVSRVLNVTSTGRKNSTEKLNEKQQNDTEKRQKILMTHVRNMSTISFVNYQIYHWYQTCNNYMPVAINQDDVLFIFFQFRCLSSWETDVDLTHSKFPCEKWEHKETKWVFFMSVTIIVVFLFFVLSNHVQLQEVGDFFGQIFEFSFEFSFELSIFVKSNKCPRKTFFFSLLDQPVMVLAKCSGEKKWLEGPRTGERDREMAWTHGQPLRHTKTSFPSHSHQSTRKIKSVLFSLCGRHSLN